MSLAKNVLGGDIKAAARLITYIDDGSSFAKNELKEIFHKTGQAYLVGITGYSGVGKSTIVDLLIRSFRKEGKKLGVIAVDPTSPFSGGAILGDRIRMREMPTDGSVFFRSLATRGAMGGLSRSVSEVVRVMEAVGKELILIETVGVGQDEVDIANLAHTTVLALIPGLGDGVQAIKAGIMEIGDIFVINKCEREGADLLENHIRAMLCFHEESQHPWIPPIVKTEAISGVGIESLVEEIKRHMEYSYQSKLFEKKAFERTQQEFLAILREYITNQTLKKIKSEYQWDELILNIINGSQDPYSISEELLHLR